jgi:hypothetical protein
MDVCLLWLLCVVVVSGWSLVQRSPTEYGVSECDRQVSITRRTWPSRGCCAIGKKLSEVPCFCDLEKPGTFGVPKLIFQYTRTKLFGIHTTGTNWIPASQ